MCAGQLCFAFAVLVSTQAIAAPGNKADVCHWDADAGVFFVINISTNAVAQHFTNHGDSYPSTYYADVDGDGFGDLNGQQDRCPNAGFVANADDCDDGNAAVNPAAAEACDDNTDNNCNGEADEGCSFCPCFSAAQLSSSYNGFNPSEHQNSNQWCQAVTADDYWWWYNYDYTYIGWQGWSYDYPYDYEADVSYYYSIDYDAGYDATYCVAQSYDYAYNYQTGQYEYNEQSSAFQYITEAEHADCEELLWGWANDNGFSCQVYNY